MTNNQLTKEWLQNRIAYMESTRDDIPFGFDEIGNNELAAFKLALAAMDSEPVAYTEKHEISNMHATGLYLRAWPADRARNAVEGYTIPLYRHAQPVPVALKDHEFRELVNQLRDIAIEYYGTQQLRERIARAIRAVMLNGGKP